MNCCHNTPQSFTAFSPQQSAVCANYCVELDLSGSEMVYDLNTGISSPYSLARKNCDAAKQQRRAEEEIKSIKDVCANAPALEVPRAVSPRQNRAVPAPSANTVRNCVCSCEDPVVPPEQKTVRTGNKSFSTASETRLLGELLDQKSTASSNNSNSCSTQQSLYKAQAEASFRRLVVQNAENRESTPKMSEEQIELAKIVQLGQRSSRGQAARQKNVLKMTRE